MKTDRKIVELIEALKGKDSGQNMLIAKVVGIDPIALKLYDLTVTKHIYVNQSFLKATASQIDNNITWDNDQDYVPSTMLNYTRKLFKADLLSVGDMVVVLQDGVSFYVLERVRKVA